MVVQHQVVEHLRSQEQGQVHCTAQEATHGSHQLVLQTCLVRRMAAPRPRHWCLDLDMGLLLTEEQRLQLDSCPLQRLVEEGVCAHRHRGLSSAKAQMDPDSLHSLDRSCHSWAWTLAQVAERHDLQALLVLALKQPYGLVALQAKVDFAAPLVEVQALLHVLELSAAVEVAPVVAFVLLAFVLQVAGTRFGHPSPRMGIEVFPQTLKTWSLARSCRCGPAVWPNECHPSAGTSIAWLL